MTTLEEAAECPRCHNQMQTEDITSWAEVRVPRGHRMLQATCLTMGCPWYNTGRVIQLTDQNLVYERPHGERGMDKSFPKMSPGMLAAGRRVLEDAVGYDVEENK